MTGITAFGAFHTAISLIAVAAGFFEFIRYRQISLATQTGQIYFWATVATCVTGLFIFHKGGFGPPHVLSIVTLIVLAGVYLAERKATFGRLSPYVAEVGFSLTLFFHMIPGFTETTTRLPVDHPLTTGPEDPRLQAAIGAAFVVFLIVAVLQVLRLRSKRRVALAI
jgi:uncharacterized membrane protein